MSAIKTRRQHLKNVNPFPNHKLQTGRKRRGKRRNCSLRAISLFPTVFSKDLYCIHVNTRACFGKFSILPSTRSMSYKKYINPPPPPPPPPSFSMIYFVVILRVCNLKKETILMDFFFLLVSLHQDCF